MQGATFLLVVNFAIGLSFAAAFLGLTWRPRIALGGWCAAGFLAAASTVAVEAFAPLIPSARLVSALSFSLLMLALTLVVVGLTRHYRADASIRPVLMLFALAAALNLTIGHHLPRETPPFALVYQLPFAAMLVPGLRAVLGAQIRRPVELVLAAVLALGLFQFVAKGFLPLFAQVQAPDVRDYVFSLYAYYSQTIFAVLSLLLGLALLGVILAEVLAEAARGMQRDSLSGLLNRAAFMERAAGVVAALPPDGRVCLVMCDLDHFKSINDRFGHAAGDEVIQIFGRVLGERAGKDALCGRIGGEEFCLLLPESNAVRVRERVEAVRAAMSVTRYGLVPGDAGVTASFGAALTHRGEHLDEALRRADLALYAAKAAGRDRYVLAADALPDAPDAVHSRRLRRTPRSGPVA